MRDKFTRYTFTGWMRRYRPDGVGHIGVSSLDSKGQPVGEPWSTTFTEVICDFCNVEIPPRQDINGEPCDSVIIASDGYALCEDCGEKALDEQIKEEAR